MNSSHLHKSLYQEIPCSDNEVQTVDLDPSHAWRFSSPNYPGNKGYPHNVACTWKFKVKPEKVSKVSIICDHINIVGNFYNNCEKGDYLSIRHDDDLNEDEAPGRLCGDLSAWIPLESSVTIEHTQTKQGYDFWITLFRDF